MYNLTQEINQKIAELNVSVKQLRQTGTEYATAERDYKIILSQETLKLRDEGMAVTMMGNVVKGIKSVAAARFKRDVAQIVYEANREAINSIKVQIRTLNDQWNAEYGTTKYGT